MKAFIQNGEFHPVSIWGLLCSMKTFIHYGDIHPVWWFLSRIEIFMLYGDFHPVWRLLSSIETLIQCWVETLSSMKAFIKDDDFCVVRGLLFSTESFLQYRYFHQVCRRLSRIETFICCRDFDPVWRLLFSVETFN